MFYLESKDSALIVHTVRGASTSTFTVAADAGPCPFNSAVISPGGDQIAWIPTGDQTGRGNLTVSDLSGANRRTLPFPASCRGGRPLNWVSPAKIAVIPAYDLREVVQLDPATGEPLGNKERGVWSDDGAWAATEDSSGNPIVMPKGSPGAARRYTYTPPADEAKRHNGWSVRSVSIDGRYVAVGWNSADSSRDLGSFAVVDTVDSQVVTLPVTGTVSSISFARDGTVLVRVAGGTLVLLDQQFNVLTRATEPASVHSLPLLRYVTPRG